jgi:PIN domain
MIVLDANILIRAVLGRRGRQLIDTYADQGVRFFALDVAFDDAEKYLPPLLKKRAKPHADFSASLEYLRSIIETVTPELTPSLKAKRDSDCGVETKVIGQYSPQHSDWHVRCGPKIRVSSALASRCGLQIESRFFSRNKQSHLNLRRHEIEG